MREIRGLVHEFDRLGSPAASKSPKVLDSADGSRVNIFFGLMKCAIEPRKQGPALCWQD